MTCGFKIEWILSALLLLGACKSRSPIANIADNEAANADSSRVDTLEVLIEALKNQLETNQKMSKSEREELEKKLKDAQAEKERVETGSTISGRPTPAPSSTTTSAPTPIPTSTSAAPKLDGPYYVYYEDMQRTDCMQPFDAANVADGSIMRGFPCNSTETQQLTLEFRDNGYFRLIHKATNKCMTLEGNTGAEGTPPTLRPCKAIADAAEQWKFFDAAADSSSFKLQSRLSNFCLKFGNDGTLFQGSCVNNYTVYRLRKSS